jgi:hypothetical protein
MTQSTKNKLIKALERLLEGKPENRDLRKKAREGKLKINNSTVEKEAGLSVGALRRHEDVQIMVKNKSLEARAMNDLGFSYKPVVIPKEVEALLIPFGMTAL